MSAINFVHQGHLQATLQTIFPNEDILQNARKTSNVRNPSTGTFLEFDFWLPQQRLCVEFQDDCHYVTKWYSHIPLDYVKQKDRYKKEMTSIEGNTVIEVPFWWDGSSDSLASTMQFQRPDFSFNHTSDDSFIPLNPPMSFFQNDGVPGIGELMLASFPATNTFVISPENPWWMGEKYDGIRMCWNPYTQKIYTRTGNELNFLSKFIPFLPKIFVDAEIWFGRGLFLDAQRVVKSAESLNLEFMRLIGFDVPLARRPTIFEARYKLLLSHLRNDNPCIIIASRKFVNTARQLQLDSQKILKEGGEGLILQQIKSLYENGRATSLIKLKAAQGDKEGIVVAVDSSGNVKIKLPDGIVFTVPHDSVECEPPEKGDIVTFSYDSYARRSEPVSPSIIRIRQDMSWDDVVRNYESETPVLDPEIGPVPSNFTEHPQGHWNAKKGNNLRYFFEDFAKKRNLDPLLPETWYNISRQAIDEVPGGSTVLDRCKGGYVSTITQVFPDIGLDESQFDVASQHWGNLRTRRKWFDAFAKRNGFDPLVPVNWYPRTTSMILQEPGGSRILRHHKFSIIHALTQVYPEIGLNENRFRVPLYNDWEDVGVRKEFFLELASEKEFDPFKAENWYQISKADLLKKRGGSAVLNYYDNSLRTALTTLFPDIGLELRKFPLTAGYWNEVSNRREFFNGIAAKLKFDPLVPSNWYNVSFEQVVAFKGAAAVLYHHKNLGKALLDLFPEIGLDASRFTQQSRDFWHDVASRRKFFEAVAAKKGKDPLLPETWYSMINNDFTAVEPNSAGIVRVGNPKYVETLSEIFPGMKLDVSKFKAKPYRFWGDKKNRRRLFEKFAKDHGFNPLVPACWYKVGKEKLLAYKGMSAVMSHNKGSFIRALREAFPEIGLDPLKFSVLPRNYWASSTNRRNFFIDFARKKQFNPLDPNEWYQVNRSSLIAFKGGYMIARLYSTFSLALMELFPELSWDSSKFK